MSATIEEIRKALQRIHHVAIGQTDRAYMSIPADPKRDADLILGAAIDELETLRSEFSKALGWLDRLTWPDAKIDLNAGPIEVQLLQLRLEHEELLRWWDQGGAPLDQMRAAEARAKALEARLPTEDQLVVLKADYERLIASLPSGPRVVR